jgi:V-type H+-transporting ATPase subunit E
MQRVFLECLIYTRIIQVAFIKQEALEKARELRVKADEEFAIEKV